MTLGRGPNLLPQRMASDEPHSSLGRRVAKRWRLPSAPFVRHGDVSLGCRCSVPMYTKNRESPVYGQQNLFHYYWKSSPIYTELRGWWRDCFRSVQLWAFSHFAVLSLQFHNPPLTVAIQHFSPNQVPKQKAQMSWRGRRHCLEQRCFLLALLSPHHQLRLHIPPTRDVKKTGSNGLRKRKFSSLQLASCEVNCEKSFPRIQKARKFSARTALLPMWVHLWRTNAAIDRQSLLCTDERKTLLATQSLDSPEVDIQNRCEGSRRLFLPNSEVFPTGRRKWDGKKF